MKRMNFALCFASVALIAGCVDGGSPGNDEARLVKKLLRGYDRSAGKLVRPVVNETDTLSVQFGISLLRADLDFDTHVLTARLWLKCQWKDYRLQWDPEKFSGINTLRLPADRFWIPDITLFNAVETPDVDTSQLVIVYSDGSVLWITPATVKVDCSTSHRYTDCRLKFGSWTYDGSKLDIDAFGGGQPDVDVDDYTHRTSLELVSHSGEKNTKYYPCCSEPYPNLSYGLKLKRVKH